jgi:hypothetical protein
MLNRRDISSSVSSLSRYLTTTMFQLTIKSVYRSLFWGIVFFLLKISIPFSLILPRSSAFPFLSLFQLPLLNPINRGRTQRYPTCTELLTARRPPATDSTPHNKPTQTDDSGVCLYRISSNHADKLVGFGDFDLWAIYGKVTWGRSRVCLGSSRSQYSAARALISE